MRRPGGPPQGPDQAGRERFSGKTDLGGGMPAAKRRNFGAPHVRTPVLAPAEESGEEEELPRKGGVQSWVVAAPTKEPLRTRKEASAEQKGDRKCMERNKRMFGMMLGTLQKFQSEESRRKDQAQKRAEIEQKLEEAAEREKAELRKERQDLFLARRQKQQSLRRLELKLEVARLHEEAEARQRLLLNFIHTRTKPHIMFKPAKHTPETQKRLKESQKRILGIIESRRAKVKEELDAIDELYRRGGGPPVEEEEEEIHRDKENRGPPEPAPAADTTEEAQNQTAEEATAENNTAGTTNMSAVPTAALGENSADQPMDVEGPAEPATSQNNDEANPETKEVAEDTVSQAKDNNGTSDAAEGVPLADAPVMDVLGDEKFEPIYDE